MASQAQSANDGGYGSLKAWLREREEYERRNGFPAPLTEGQRNAITILTQAASPVQSQLPGDWLDKDWVSLLGRKSLFTASGSSPPLLWVRALHC